jgi:hypothetical protein
MWHQVMGTKVALQQYDKQVQARVHSAVKRIAQDSNNITNQVKL